MGIGDQLAARDLGTQKKDIRLTTFWFVIRVNQ